MNKGVGGGKVWKVCTTEEEFTRDEGPHRVRDEKR